MVNKQFHVSQATLDVKSVESGDEYVQVFVEVDNENHLLCNLNLAIPQVSLDLGFSEGETIAFFSRGAGIIHLTGYMIEDEDEDFGGDLDDEALEEEARYVSLIWWNWIMDLVWNRIWTKFSIHSEVEDGEEDDHPSLKKKKAVNARDARKFLEAAGEEDSDSDSDIADFLEEDDDDDDELGEEEQDVDEDEDEEESVSPPAKLAKLDKSAKQQNGLTNGKAAAAAESNDVSQKKKKDKKKKNKSQDGSEAQKVENKSNVAQAQQQPKAKAIVTPTRTLAQGVVIEDLRTGKGPEAKAGKRVSVYYEGRLKSNNKVFDSTKGGDGFKFSLGRSEVIRGWDIGCAGMKVGGKRRITCPPNTAYGAKGQPPVIPPNATLVFDVELRGVN